MAVHGAVQGAVQVALISDENRSWMLLQLLFSSLIRPTVLPLELSMHL